MRRCASFISPGDLRLAKDDGHDLASIASPRFAWHGRRRPRDLRARFPGLHAALRLIHQSIKVAKLRRLQNELIFHADDGGEESADQNAARYPQRPLILSDKWDF
jgi:hypothetical protein